MVQIAADYSRWMAQNDLPKLFVNAEPGAILIGAPREFCRSWNNQTEVTVPGSHFIQEDSGPAIGRAVAGWIRTNALMRPGRRPAAYRFAVIDQALPCDD